MVAPSLSRREGRGREQGGSRALQRERWAICCSRGLPWRACYVSEVSQRLRSAKSCRSVASRRRQA
eukprot:26042-Prorocentrum_lima.AAC.1